MFYQNFNFTNSYMGFYDPALYIQGKNDIVSELIDEDYISVVPLFNNNDYGTLRSIVLQSPIVIDSDIDYLGYNDEDLKASNISRSYDVNNATSYAYIGQLLQPYDLLSNFRGPIEMYSIEELLFGSYPLDESNEIIVSQNIALYYMNDMGLYDIEDLLGKKINLKILDEDEEFIISGIYRSSNYEDNFYLSYDYNKEISQFLVEGNEFIIGNNDETAYYKRISDEYIFEANENVITIDSSKENTFYYNNTETIVKLIFILILAILLVSLYFYSIISIMKRSRIVFYYYDNISLNKVNIFNVIMFLGCAVCSYILFILIL